MSSVWNFCVRLSAVFSRGTPAVDVVVKCRLFSQAALAENCLRWIEIRTRKDCKRYLACRGSSNRGRQEKGEETEERFQRYLLSLVLSGRSAAPLLWSLSEGLTISQLFAELFKTPRSGLILS